MTIPKTTAGTTDALMRAAEAARRAVEEAARRAQEAAARKALAEAANRLESTARRVVDQFTGSTRTQPGTPPGEAGGGNARPVDLGAVNALAARLGIPAAVAQSIAYNPDLTPGAAFQVLLRTAGNADSVSAGQLGDEVTPEQVREWQAQGYTVALWNASGVDAAGQPPVQGGDNVVMGADVENLLTSGVYGGGQGWEVAVIAPAGSGLPLPTVSAETSATGTAPGELTPQTRAALEQAGWPPEAIAVYEATSQALAALEPQSLQDVQGMVTFAQQNPEAAYVGVDAEGLPVALDGPPLDGTAYIYQPPANPALPPQAQAQPVLVSGGAQVPLSFVTSALADRAASTVSGMPPEQFNTVSTLVSGGAQAPGEVALPPGWELRLEPGQTALTAGATLLVDGQPYTLGELRTAVGLSTLEQMAYLPPEHVASVSDLLVPTGAPPGADAAYLHPDGNWGTTPPAEGPYLQRLPSGESVVMINGFAFPPEAVSGALALRAAEVAPDVASPVTATNGDIIRDTLEAQLPPGLADVTWFAASGVPQLMVLNEEGHPMLPASTPDQQATYLNQLYLPAADALLQSYPPGTTVEVVALEPGSLTREHGEGMLPREATQSLDGVALAVTQPDGTVEYFAVNDNLLYGRATDSSLGVSTEVLADVDGILRGDTAIESGLAYDYVDGSGEVRTREVPFIGQDGILVPVSVSPSGITVSTDLGAMLAAMPAEPDPLAPFNPASGSLPVQAFTFNTPAGPVQVEVPPSFDLQSVFQMQAARGGAPQVFLDPAAYSAQGYENRARFELAQQLGIVPDPANLPPELVTLMETDPAAAAAWLDDPANWDGLDLFPSGERSGAYLDSIMRHVEAENGDGPLHVTTLTVVVESPDAMPQPYPVLRFEREDGTTYFVDHTGKFHEDWEDWETGGVYPPDTKLYYPPGGNITVDGNGRAEYTHIASPGTVDTWQEQADQFLDTASVVVGFGATVVGLLGVPLSGGASLTLTAAGMGAMGWQVKEGVERIHTMHEQHVDRGSAEYLWEYASVGFNLLGLGSTGVATLARFAGPGTGLARAAGMMGALSNAAGVAELGGSSYMLASQWERMDSGQRLSALFGLAMSAGGVASNFRQGLGYTDAFGAPGYTGGIRFTGAVDAMFNPRAQSILATVDLAAAYPGANGVPDFAAAVARPGATVITADGRRVNARTYMEQLNASGTESYFVMGRNRNGDIRLFEMTAPDPATPGQVSVQQYAFTRMVEQGYLPLSGGHNHPGGSTVASQADLEAAPVVAAWAQGIYSYYGIQGHTFDNSIITANEGRLSATRLDTADGAFSIRTRSTTFAELPRGPMRDGVNLMQQRTAAEGIYKDVLAEFPDGKFHILPGDPTELYPWTYNDPLTGRTYTREEWYDYRLSVEPEYIKPRAEALERQIEQAKAGTGTADVYVMIGSGRAYEYMLAPYLNDENVNIIYIRPEFTYNATGSKRQPFVIGEPQPGNGVVLIENDIDTGRSLIETSHRLEGLGYDPDTVFVYAHTGTNKGKFAGLSYIERFLAGPLMDTLDRVKSGTP